MSPKFCLVVVDDHALFRRGLISLLNEMPEFEVVGDAANGRDAMEIIRDTQPDLVLLDVNMPEMGGLETLREIRGRNTELPVLMLTISQDDDALLGAILAGASGYLLKNAEPELLQQVILRVLAGESVLSPEVTAKVFAALRRMQAERGRSLLSNRELEVLHCMRRGLTTPEISAELFISENTVKTHVQHILEKLGVRKRSEAAARAAELNLV
jgi:DNA-binding NarL/FixJ family response regulator